MFSVIARSACDEAIHGAACRTMDCFAALAMTVDGVGFISRSLSAVAEPLSYPCVGVGILRHVADDGDRVGAGSKDLGGLFELDAADRDQGNVADALFPFGDFWNAL